MVVNDLQQATSISELKSKVENVWGIRKHLQDYATEGQDKSLHNKMTLQEAGIKPGCATTIVCLISTPKPEHSFVQDWIKT